MAEESPEKRVRGFIAKFAPKHQTLIRAARRMLRTRMPTASELVYDNYNFFVIGYSPSERPTDTIVSLTAAANGVGLMFPYCGTKLPDPHKILLGSGRQNRFIRVESAATLSRPEVQVVISAAVGLSKPLPTTGKRKLIIRLIAPKQRPRRRS
jgi:hypothetical protein